MSSFGISRIGRAAAGVIVLSLVALPACGTATGGDGDAQETLADTSSYEPWKDIASDDSRIVFLDGDSTTKFVFRLDGDVVTGKAAYTEYGGEQPAKVVADGIRTTAVDGISSVRTEGTVVVIEYDEVAYAGMTADDVREACEQMTEVAN